MIIKKLAGMISICLMCVCVLNGCGKSATEDSEDRVKVDSVETKDNSAAEDAQTEESGENSDTASSGYAFVSGGTEIVVDMDMSTIEDKLGEPANYYEEPSCAAQGIAKIYTYSGFQIETYPDGDKDLIACVVLKDDSVATPEGVDLSMTKDDIISTYGSDYEESGTSMVYEKNGTKLCFILDGEDIASIEYDSPVLN